MSNCQTAIKEKAISGTIQNGANLTVHLDKMTIGGANTVVGSTQIDEQGNFKVPLEEGLEAGLYRIRIGAKRAFLPIEGGETSLNINGSLESFDKYDFSVKGSDAASEAISTIKKMVSRQIEPVGVQNEIRDYKSPMAAAVVSYLAMNNPQYLSLIHI